MTLAYQASVTEFRYALQRACPLLPVLSDSELRDLQAFVEAQVEEMLLVEDEDASQEQDLAEINRPQRQV